jgi:hypothetical protein
MLHPSSKGRGLFSTLDARLIPRCLRLRLGTPDGVSSIVAASMVFRLSHQETFPHIRQTQLKFWYLPRLTPTSSGPHHRYRPPFLPAVTAIKLNCGYAPGTHTQSVLMSDPLKSGPISKAFKLISTREPSPSEFENLQQAKGAAQADGELTSSGPDSELLYFCPPERERKEAI